MAIHDTDYMYASARLRALENNLFSFAKYEQLADAKSAADIFSILSESGYTVAMTQSDEGEPPHGDLEATLSDEICRAFELVKTIIPSPDEFEFLRFEFDCNNLKAAIKTQRGENSDGMFYSCGTRTAEAAREAVKEKSFSEFPRNMAEKSLIAAEELASSGDAQRVDLLLDRACFADMAAAARGDFSRDMLAVKSDLINIITALRFIYRKNTNVFLLSSALVPGGKLSESFFDEAVQGGETKLCENLRYSEYASLCAPIEQGGLTLGRFERLCDDFYIEKLRRAKFVPFGEAVVFAYLSAKLYEVKNLRMIFSLKEAGTKPDVIRERVRLSYV